MIEADAAAVASQLLAFLREPVRHRPRFIHGEEEIPAGEWVFKFAHGRLPKSLLRDLSDGQRRDLREAAAAFIRQVCLRDGATHYQVLCLPASASLDAVKENYHLMMGLIHPDRPDTASQWPSGSAQRVNRAYAALSDDAQRAEYDAGLRKLDADAARPADLTGGAPIADRPKHPLPPAEAISRMGRPLALVTGAASAIVLFQMWLVSDMPAEYTTLERAFPFDASLRWMREAIGNAHLPRFLVAESPTPAAKRDDDPSFLASLWRDKEPEPGAQAAKPKADVEAKTPTVPAPTIAAVSQTAPAAPAAGQRSGTEGTKGVPATSGAASSESEARAAPSTSAVPKDQRIRTADIEAVVARLISFYEAGDLDHLMGLVDTADTGFWKTEQMRQLYHEFFRSTKRRQLKLNRLAWQVRADSAQARGQATISAEYFDEPGTVERKVDVELSIGLREGRPKIMQLTLFPNGT